MARNKAFNEAEVLDKAIDLFRMKGYNGASMQDVVDCLGLSRSSIYDTFGDKHELLLLSLKKYSADVAYSLVDLIVNAPDVKVVVRQLLQRVVTDSLTDCQHRGCFMVNSSVELAPHDPQVEGLVKDNTDLVERALAQAIERAQKNGLIPDRQDPQSLASFYFNTISGLRVAEKSGASKESMEAVIAVAMSVLD